MSTFLLEFYVRRKNFWSRDENILIPEGLVTAKASFYVKTDVEGRRLGDQ